MSVRFLRTGGGLVITFSNLLDTYPIEAALDLAARVMQHPETNDQCTRLKEALKITADARKPEGFYAEVDL